MDGLTWLKFHFFIEYSDRYAIRKVGLLHAMKGAAFLLPVLILPEPLILPQRINI